MNGYIKYLLEVPNHSDLTAVYYHGLMGSYWYVENVHRALPNLTSVWYTDIVEVERSKELEGFVNTNIGD